MTHPRGRQAIGLNQPPNSGSLYPFVQPSADIRDLLGDFFLSFARREVAYPLRVVWLYGFGTEAGPAPPGDWPAPTHTQDLRVVDANDVLIFDSTVCDRFTSSVWDNRLLILEWTGDAGVCRCTAHTQWTAADVASGQARTYTQHILPENGELQADCWYQVPQTVNRLRHGVTLFEGGILSLCEGYNIGLNLVTEQTVPTLSLSDLTPVKAKVVGERPVTRIRLDAIPGNGLGTFPGCGQQDAILRTINRVQSNSHQNFSFDTEGCIRTKRPVSLSQASPRTFAYAAPEVSAEQAAASLQLNNNCTNCCNCTYFAQTYQGLKRQWFLHRDLARRLESTRDSYAANRARWLAEKQLREEDNLRLRVSMDGNCKVRWGIAFCNASKCCLTGIRLYLFFVAYLNGIPYYLYGFDSRVDSIYMCAPAQLENSSRCCGPETLKDVPFSDVPGQVSDVPGCFYYQWDFSDPQSVTTLCGRVCLQDAFNAPPQAVKVKVWAGITWLHTFPDPADGIVCSLPTVNQGDIPPEVQQMWERLGLPTPITVHGQQVSKLMTVDQNNPFCERCDCFQYGF